MNTEEMQKQIESMMPTPEQIVEHLDKKLEEARRLYKTANSDQKYILESLYPQLKESDGDRIRKNLFTFFKDEYGINSNAYFAGIKVKDVVAWLEKQGDKDRLIQELGEYKVKYTQEVLEKDINSMGDEDEESIRKNCIHFLELQMKHHAATFEIEECISWLESIKVPSVSDTDKSFINDIKNIINEAPGVLQSDKNRVISWLEKQCQKEVAWDKEDEENMNNVLYILNQLKDTSSYEEDNIAEKTINWLKHLKGRLRSNNDCHMGISEAIKYCTRNDQPVEKHSL